MLSLVLGGVIVGLAAILVYYVRKYQSILSDSNLIREENEVLHKQLKSIVYNKSGAGRLYKELRAKYKNN